MTQPSFSFLPLARSTDPDTSHEAADHVDGMKIANRVLAELRANGPGTSHEIADRTGLSLVTVSPRMRPLECAGEVVRIGRRNRRTIWAYRG